MKRFFFGFDALYAASFLTAFCGVFLGNSERLWSQQPYAMTIRYANTQTTTTIAVWTIRAMTFGSSAGSSVPDKLSIVYRSSTMAAATIPLSSIREITFSGSPTYTGDTLRIARKNASALSFLGASVQKIIIENAATRVAGNMSAQDSRAFAYPNPSGSSVTIEFSLPHAGEIEATLYDVVGNEVATLMRERRDAGTHTVGWNGTNARGEKVAAGTYFCRIVSGSALVAQTMIIMR